MLSLWIVALLLLPLSLFLVGVYRQFALARRWVDTPNHRSSHTQIIPRGAGIIFALLIGLAAGIGLAGGAVPAALAGAVFSGLGIALVGWWDDLSGVSARYRFGLYWLTSCLALALLSGASGGLPQSWMMLILLLVGSLAWQWLINLYNFMDGVNGIAAVEAIFVLCAMLLLGVKTEGLSWLAACSIAALSGFLFWNFPNARVFMGDAGSAFLGFFLGLMMIWSALKGGVEVVVWLILLGVFMVDATYTLVVRIVTGQAWYQGHRLHAYQILASTLGGHARVVVAMLLINLFWLLPWAWAAYLQWVPGFWALALAYLPLVGICCAVGAGNLSPSRV